MASEFDWAKLQKDNKPGALDTSLESVNECFRTEMLLLRVVFSSSMGSCFHGIPKHI